MSKSSYSIFVILILAFISGCEQSKNTAMLEQERTEKNQSKLLKSQPPVSLSFSLERANINKRTTLWNDEAKVSYIYLVDYGKIMAFYTIKGKVSSVNSQITNPQQLTSSVARLYNGSHIVSGTLPSPAEDGSYGTNRDAIFFFTTDDTYVEWAGNYMLCDKPLKLLQPPVVSIAETKELSLKESDSNSEVTSNDF